MIRENERYAADIDNCKLQLQNCELVLTHSIVDISHLSDEDCQHLLFEIALLKNAMTSDTAPESIPDVHHFVERFTRLVNVKPTS